MDSYAWNSPHGHISSIWQQRDRRMNPKHISKRGSSVWIFCDELQYDY